LFDRYLPIICPFFSSRQQEKQFCYSASFLQFIYIINYNIVFLDGFFINVLYFWRAFIIGADGLKKMFS
jgi:hypothetical protein